LPSKQACWAHQFRYLGVGQQYPPVFLVPRQDCLFDRLHAWSLLLGTGLQGKCHTPFGAVGSLSRERDARPRSVVEPRIPKLCPDAEAGKSPPVMVGVALQQCRRHTTRPLRACASPPGLLLPASRWLTGRGCARHVWLCVRVLPDTIVVLISF
jgi:hypothetical protein